MLYNNKAEYFCIVKWVNAGTIYSVWVNIATKKVFCKSCEFLIGEEKFFKE